MGSGESNLCSAGTAAKPSRDVNRAPSFVAALFVIQFVTIAMGAGTSPSTEYFKGVVLDKQTKTPVEGAYVVATYEEEVRSIAVATTRCRKTVGMLTGPDGLFSFPVERPDGMSPSTAVAIKPGYYLDGLHWARGKGVEVPRAERVQEIWVMRQDEKKPQLFNYAAPTCVGDGVRRRSDGAAAARYLRMVADELQRYGAKEAQISSSKSLASHLEELPQ